MPWIGKKAKPTFSGYHYVRSRLNKPGQVSIRYFDDSNGGSWWLPGNAGFTPNDSFYEWLTIPGISNSQRS